VGDELVSVVGGTTQPAHASLWLRPPGRVVEEKGEAKCEKIVGEEFRNAFRNVGETVDNYNGGQGGQMTAPTENKRGFWQKLLRRDGSKVPEETSAVADVPRQAEPELEIAPNDPILAYLASVSGVVEIEKHADGESFTVMTPEGHPESGWNTFSAYTDEDGVTVAQIQSLARANDPIYELGFRVVGATEQERIWTHVLKSLAGHFGVNEPVTLEKACVDPKLQWSQIKNLWHNAGARSMLYTMTGRGAGCAA
jgi:Domain of unknown function (DUF1990)